MADNNSTTNIGKGLTAGLAATVALLILMILKAQVGLMPGLDIPKMLAGLAGAPGQPLVGWAVHLVIGIVLYGIAIATLDDRLPGDGSLMHGLVLAVVGCLIMMLVLMTRRDRPLRHEHEHHGGGHDVDPAFHLRRRSWLDLRASDAPRPHPCHGRISHGAFRHPCLEVILLDVNELHRENVLGSGDLP